MNLTNKKFYTVLLLLIAMCVLISSCQTKSNIPTQASQNKELEWEWCIEPKYEHLYFLADDLVGIRTDGEYSILNMDGEPISSQKYFAVSGFDNGIAAVETTEGSFFINKSGENVFGEVFKATRGFCEGLAAVCKDDLWGFINEQGEIVINYQFDEVQKFNEQLAVVRKNNKWGAIKKSGKVAVDFQFDAIRSFQNGYAAVMNNSKWGVINKSGKLITACQFDEVRDFSEGLAGVMKDSKWGFVDENGNIAIELKYDAAGNFSEGKAAVKLEQYENMSSAWAYIDQSDNAVIDFYEYDAAGDIPFVVGDFNDGLAFVSKTLLSIIDETGANVFLGDSEFFISFAKYYKELDAIPGYVYTDSAMKVKKYGLLGLDGKQRLEPVFDYIYGIYGDYVVVGKTVDGEGLMGVIRLS